MVRVLSFTLALLIALTSQQMAAARSLAYDAAGQVILCTGHGVVTITVDKNGDPLETVHICPDCVLYQLADTAQPAQVKPPVIHMDRLGQTVVQVMQNPVRSVVGSARAPPAVV